MSLFGVININKPGGVTSRWVVDQVQRLVRPAKSGHAGTLDPLAAGVLVVCVGPATRLVPYVQQMPKRYAVTFLLGRTSDTDDVEGSITLLDNAPRPSPGAIRQAAADLVGEILQRPPAYSAIKVQGRRAYQLARSGKPPVLPPRTVTVRAIDIVKYEYPELMLDIQCGSGVYVRSLGRDLAESLGGGAVMSALTRTAIGAFQIEDACDPRKLTRDNIGEFLLPPRLAAASLPLVTLTSEEARRLAGGLTVKRAATPPAQVKELPSPKEEFAATDDELPSPDEEFAALDEAGRLVAIVRSRCGELRPLRNFPREC